MVRPCVCILYYNSTYYDRIRCGHKGAPWLSQWERRILITTICISCKIFLLLYQLSSFEEGLRLTGIIYNIRVHECIYKAPDTTCTDIIKKIIFCNYD